ncbi:hypothetical protein [Azohydromonas caseinilytica]|uniref:Uncharacterized protein n=1 Tax=Azohydromonas caseinilytica TaxID=2728836 RepID=A0A848FEY1_9BURK|nr:hypothetical protein [Azohydromonas caseinilytica]NML18787.1 hypothetical protein [Azohydromonas caseinilytica]
MTMSRTDAPAPSYTEIVDRLLPAEIQYEIDDEGLLTFTPAGESYWQPLFGKWGYVFDRSLPVEEFEDISTAILLNEMQGLRAVAVPAMARPCIAA